MTTKRQMMKEAIALAVLLLLTALLFWCVEGCTASHGPPEPCAVDEGLVLDEAGEVVHGITQCALCRRFELAYEARAAELGCELPWPDACEDEGLTDCHLETIENYADFSWATGEDACERMHEYASRPDTYHAFICGPSCVLTGIPDREECCPGTPYALRSYRRCPYWCYGLSQCGRDPECELLYESSVAER